MRVEYKGISYPHHPIKQYAIDLGDFKYCDIERICQICYVREEEIATLQGRTPVHQPYTIRHVNGDGCIGCLYETLNDVRNKDPEHSYLTKVCTKDYHFIKRRHGQKSGCVTCRDNKSISPRQAAMRNGDKWYMGDAPCGTCGAMAERHVSNAICRNCGESSKPRQSERIYREPIPMLPQVPVEIRQPFDMSQLTPPGANHRGELVNDNIPDCVEMDDETARLLGFKS